MDNYVLKWTAQEPTTALDAGYPALPGAEVIHLLKDQDGQMNHHPHMEFHQGHFFLMHTHHPLNHHESSQGRNMLGWVADGKGEQWIGPLELMPPPDDVTPKVIKDLDGKHCLGFAIRWVVASDGHVYAVMRVGYKIWNDPVHAQMATHYTIGYLARTVAYDGTMGELFWCTIKEDPSPFPKLNYPDRTTTPLGEELTSLTWAGPPEGGGLSPQGIHCPSPWRNFGADALPICEYATVPIGNRALCLARAGNFTPDPVHYVGWSDDNGVNWSPLQKTNIPSAQNWSHIGKLPDGRLYILGSLARNDQRQRAPLAIATSDDGIHFNKVWSVMADRIHAVRNSIVHDGYVWAGICHGGKKNAGRQDVAVVKIPVNALT